MSRDIPLPMGFKQRKITAASSALSMYSGVTNTGGVDRTSMALLPPNYDPLASALPLDDIKTMNPIYRHFSQIQPILANCIDIHAQFPLSDFSLNCSSEELKDYYNILADKYELDVMMENILRDAALLGEAFYIGNWDAMNNEWEDFVQYPPEFIDVTVSQKTNRKIFKLDNEIINTRTKNQNFTQMDRQAIKELENYYLLSTLFNTSKTKQTIIEDRDRLSESQVIYFRQDVNGYSKRGTPLTKRVLKELLRENDLYSLHANFIQRHLFPLKIYKLGSKEMGWIPNKAHFTQFKKLLLQSALDPDFSIIYHFGLEVDYVGTKDKIENLIPHFEWVAKRILNGFFVNDAMINGEAVAYASQTANIKFLMYRFHTKRKRLEKLIIDKIFLPIAKKQGFIRPKPNNVKNHVIIKSKTYELNQYILPVFNWTRSNIINNTQEQQLLIQLYEKGDIPFSILADVFGIDKNILRDKKVDDQQDNIFVKSQIQEIIKTSPKLLLMYIEGKTPKEIVSEKIKIDKELQEVKNKTVENITGNPDEGKMPENFDSSGGITIDDSSGENSEDGGNEEANGSSKEEPGTAQSQGNDVTNNK